MAWDQVPPAPPNPPPDFDWSRYRFEPPVHSSRAGGSGGWFAFLFGFLLGRG